MIKDIKAMHEGILINTDIELNHFDDYKKIFNIIELLSNNKDIKYFWYLIKHFKSGYIRLQNDNKNIDFKFYPNTWDDKNFKIHGFYGKESFFDTTIHYYG